MSKFDVDAVFMTRPMRINPVWGTTEHYHQEAKPIPEGEGDDEKQMQTKAMPRVGVIVRDRW
jgi:hypothetical protein